MKYVSQSRPTDDKGQPDVKALRTAAYWKLLGRGRTPVDIVRHDERHDDIAGKRYVDVKFDLYPDSPMYMNIKNERRSPASESHAFDIEFISAVKNLLISSGRKTIDARVAVYSIAGYEKGRVYEMIFDVPEGCYLSTPWNRSSQLLVSTSRETNDVAEASANLLRRLGCEDVYVSLCDQGEQKRVRKHVREELRDAKAEAKMRYEDRRSSVLRAREMLRKQREQRKRYQGQLDEQERSITDLREKLTRVEGDRDAAQESLSKEKDNYRTMRKEGDNYRAELTAVKSGVAGLLKELEEDSRGVGLFNYKSRAENLQNRIKAFKKQSEER